MAFRKKKLTENPSQLGLFDLNPKLVPGGGGPSRGAGDLAVQANTGSHEPPSPEALPVGADRSVWMRLETGFFGYDQLPEAPLSRFTRDTLCAIEASRVQRGLSVEIAGLQNHDTTWCWNCLKYLCGGYVYTKLFKPERDGKVLQGEAFSCYKCKTSFEAHTHEFY